MNSLFNSALKQSSAVRKDLDVFAENPLASSPALQGQISASLTSLSRTIDDYDGMAKRELIPAKQEKAFERVKNFRSELLDFRQQFERLKAEKDETQTTVNRAELLGRRPHHTSTPENPYNNPPNHTSAFHPRPQPPSSFGAAPSEYARESHALREASFMSSTNAQLDEFLDRGRAVLGDLGQQREILKGTQRRLYSVANTLGVSGDTIRMVERRAKQDKIVMFENISEMAGYQPSPQPSLPFDVVIPPDFAHPREPGAFQDPSSLRPDMTDALRSYTMSSAASETTSCMTFYSAQGTASRNGKPDEAQSPPFSEQREMGSPEDLRIERSDSGYKSIDSPTDARDDFRGDVSDPGDSTTKLTGRAPCPSKNTQSVRRDDNARGTRRKSSASDRSHSRSKEHNRMESDASRAKSLRHSGSSAYRRSSNTDPKLRPGPERPVSIHSSKSFKGASSASRTGSQPTIPTRGSSSTLPRRRTDGPVTKQQACHMFQSLSATLARYDTAHTDPGPDLRSSSVSALRHSASIPVGGDLPYLMATHIDQNSPHARDVLVPCTVIDWKSTTTRRREYAEIDKRDRGLRGWWRRWSPSWCSRSPRHVFYEGNKSDAGSVRRYRLELPDEDMSTNIQEGEKSMGVVAGRARFPWPRMSRAWSCFNLGEEPSGRWLSTVALTKCRNSPHPQDVWGCLDEKQRD
ncbi:MAG: protein transport protein bos1 [Geoglossum umbratile]|nr:MAG: protein transport protein bos1 [Geoglossum umbratile]